MTAVDLAALRALAESSNPSIPLRYVRLAPATVLALVEAVEAAQEVALYEWHPDIRGTITLGSKHSVSRDAMGRLEAALAPFRQEQPDG